MSLKSGLRLTVEKLTGTRIYRVPPRGIDLFGDLGRDLPSLQIQTIFDVGANVGQSATYFRQQFSAANIYCFEPVAATYQKLTANLAAMKNIQCFNLALGQSTGRAEMTIAAESDQASMNANSSSEKTESVEIDTLDALCAAKNNPKIEFLKIDTEGHDLDVLKGATAMLGEQAIDVIQVEAGMNRENTLHVPFGDFVAFLEPKNYFLFGIYEQVDEWPTRSPHLRRTNPVFISRRLIDSNRR